MLRLHNLSKTYANQTRALEDFSADIAPGEAVAVIGGSGCGKSTLLRLIAGLEIPTRGRVWLDNELIAEPHPSVGFVFQEPRLLPWLTVRENVAFGLDDLPAKERAARAEAVLAQVGLSGQGDRWPRELSGGMAQRVALARGLVSDPDVLLLDEPFSALDALTRADLQDHLAELWQDRRQSLIFVTHDIEEALVLADRVIVLRPRPGRIAECVSVDLPRPRDRSSQAFEEAKRHLRATLDRSLVGLRDPSISARSYDPVAAGLAARNAMAARFGAREHRPEAVVS